jgi:uncharacterized protein (TIRG00374 family)
MRKFAGNYKLFIGILLSLVFMYLAFRKVNFTLMRNAFAEANYWFLLPTLALIFFSHYLRSVRWQMLLLPIRRVEAGALFSSLMIGYLFNLILPAHLGEFVRAYMVNKKRAISASAVFGTIVIERIIDVFALLLLMALSFIVFPFPDWVRKSGYITFVGILLLFFLLILMKRNRDRALQLFTKLATPLPQRLSVKVIDLMYSFLDGIVPLQKGWHYFAVTALSIIIWGCYGYAFQLIFYAFDFVNLYSLPWTAALVLLVITTISVLVPSSPGYVGAYHYLCQLSLGLFAVPESPALTFAFVMHGINFLPILIVGLILVSAEGLTLRSVQNKAKLDAGA